MALTELQTKQAAFIEDALGHFNSTNLGIVDKRCLYTAGCMIGRKLPKELSELLDAVPEGTDGTALFEQFPIELKELGQDFLGAMQEFHDLRENWSPTGLSDYGAEVMKGIKFQFGLT